MGPDMLTTLCLACLNRLPVLVAAVLAPDVPVVTVQADDTPIASSCRIEIPPSLILSDANRNGVVQIVASNIVVEFAPGAVLRGADADAAPDTYEGCGVRIVGQHDVTIRGGRISGFRAAVWASDAPGLTLENIDASENRRMRLHSTPEKEAGEDWLYPHNNDERKWLDEYGSALYIERSDRLTVRDCKVWHGQNALCLDRVNDARIYDNDFSFNSGWGIALWRSCRNVVTRNACDFCIRGYSHGVYNRGQDSAGLLFFEQCSENVVAENSATHCGDGFFGFAGKAALAQSAQPASASAPATAPASATGDRTSQRTAVGCDRNLLINNDFSYAAAHGIEMTFSFDNRFLGNRLVGNSICGIWAGYCQRTLIAGNEIAENGAAGYGLERGGIDIDSGCHNQILWNRFHHNACGVHLWWLSQPPNLVAWAQRNLANCEGNVISGNVFDADELTFHFRGHGQITLDRSAQRQARNGCCARSNSRAPGARTARAVSTACLPSLREEAPGRRAGQPGRPREHHHDRVGAVG
jgi:parallel beta-helix repeat protein